MVYLQVKKTFKLLFLYGIFIYLFYFITCILTQIYLIEEIAWKILIFVKISQQESIRSLDRFVPVAYKKSN